jgi:hypothetical protein
VEPDVAVLKNGGWVFAWADGNIFCRIYDSSGVAGLPEFPVSTNLTNSQIQTSSKVAALTSGGWVTVWKSLGNIYGRFFNASNVANGPEFLINLNTTGCAYPAVTGLPNGGWVAAWQGTLNGANGIFFRIFNSLMPLGPESPVITATGSSFYNTVIESMEDGSFRVLWDDNRGSNNVFSRKYDDAGTAWGSDVPISNNMTGSNSYPACALIADGTFLTAWTNTVGDFNILGQRFYQNESRVTTNLTLPAPSPAQFPSPAPMPVPAPIPAPFPAPIPLPSPATIPSPAPVQTAVPAPIQAPFPAPFPPPSPTPVQTVVPAPIQSPFPTQVPVPSPLAYMGTSSRISSTSTPSLSSNSDPTSTMTSSNSVTSSSDNYSSILSINEISYQVPYNIYINDQIVGTFIFSGGTGAFDGDLQNTINIDLDSSYVGETITLFTIPESAPEGMFETIELVGASCQTIESQIVDQGGAHAYQITFSGTTCSPATKPALLA